MPSLSIETVQENVAGIARTLECLGVGSLHLVYTQDQEINSRGFGRLSDELKACPPCLFICSFWSSPGSSRMPLSFISQG